MSEEEAIERLNRKIISEIGKENIGVPVRIKDLETVLNMLEKKNEEIERSEVEYHELAGEINRLETELAEKDGIIDEMAYYLSDVRTCPKEDFDVDIDCENRCSNENKLIADCWRKYFEKRASE